MKMLFAAAIAWVVMTLLLKKKKNVITDFDSNQSIGRRELKELMELSRKNSKRLNRYEETIVGKVQIFLRDFSYENYLKYGHELYTEAFHQRLEDILSSMAVNCITGFPNRDLEIEHLINGIFDETGMAIIEVMDGETSNIFRIGNLEKSIYLPDPRLNKVLGFHRTLEYRNDWITPSDIVKNFLIPHPIKTFTE